MKKLSAALCTLLLIAPAVAFADSSPSLSPGAQQFAIIHQEQDCQTGWATAFDERDQAIDAQAQIDRLHAQLLSLQKQLDAENATAKAKKECSVMGSVKGDFKPSCNNR